MSVSPENLSQTNKVLLIDIGGTNIRTCSAVVGSNALINPRKDLISTSDSLNILIKKSLDDDPLIKNIVLSIAGPKINNSITMTNREFTLSVDEIVKKFDISSCHLLNDWESIGHSLSLFDKGDMSVIVEGNGFNNTALIIGPGTGLGASLVINGEIVLPTEIGNSTLSLASLVMENNLQDSKTFQTIEDLISGPGLSKIYHRLAGAEKTPEEIIMSVTEDLFAQHSIDKFLKCLAQLVSELALAYIPGNGIFFAGSLMRSLSTFIDSQEFLDNFLVNRKPMHQDLLKNIPIALIQKEMTCLHGNLNYFNKLHFKEGV